MPDVDIDFFDRDKALKLFKHRPASIIKEETIEKFKKMIVTFPNKDSKDKASNSIMNMKQKLGFDVVDNDLTIKDYLKQIISSFKEISKKKFVFNYDQYSNIKKITNSIEIVYGLRNFIGNAVKFSNQNILISIVSDNINLFVIIEDDGPGFPEDIIKAIGEPYIKSRSKLSRDS